MARPKQRGGAASLKSKASTEDKHVLLARGMSARYTGANVPISGLAPDEVERDLRHIEAFSNACIAYAQQYFIFQNQNEAEEDDNGLTYPPANAPSNISPQPLLAMPVRIDPEEEKRLAILRQKIQQTESQREVMESQYLSLRAHYVYISQVLKKLRGNINDQLHFLQSLLRKRGDLVAIQRTRLQIARETLACLKYRKQRKDAEGPSDAKSVDTSMDLETEKDPDTDSVNASDSMDVDEGKRQDGETEKDTAATDILALWESIESKFKQAEELCHEGGGSVMAWSALKVPSTPPGVPLLLSQLSSDPGYGAAYAASGMFGSAQNDLCWLVDNLADYTETAEKLEGLREESKAVAEELYNERTTNRDLQQDIIACRKRNDALVSTMTFLRTETEAVIARHNIVLESKEGKAASLLLHEKEAKQTDAVENDTTHDDQDDDDGTDDGRGDINTNGEGDVANNDDRNGESKSVGKKTNANGTSHQRMGSDAPNGVTEPLGANSIGVLKDASKIGGDSPAAVARRMVEESNENDGDDEGQVGDEDDEEEEGEVLGDEERGEISEKDKDKRVLETSADDDVDVEGHAKKRRKV